MRGELLKNKGVLRHLLILVLAASLVDPASSFGRSQPAGVELMSYAEYDRLTRKYVNEQGLVDYAGLKRELPALSTFVDQLAAVSPENHPEMFLTEDDRKRYYLVAYNALVLFFAASAYPNKHALWSRFGSFKDKDIVLGGRELTLNHLEHEIIRKDFLDPRIHFYINCPAKSCPPLQMGVIAPGMTEFELEKAAREFINDPTHVRFEATTRKLYLSKIFDWFSKDFVEHLRAKHGLTMPHISDYIALYLTGPSAQALARVRRDRIKVRYLKYDKGLNEQ